MKSKLQNIPTLSTEDLWHVWTIYSRHCTRSCPHKLVNWCMKFSMKYSLLSETMIILLNGIVHTSVSGYS